MKKAYLTAGPQGAGKSTFCERVIAAHPEIVLVSRDKILVSIFGTTFLNPYEGGHEVAYEKMWQVVAEELQYEEATIILDCWNGFPRERARIASMLRLHGAEYVEAWVFTTPQETCVEWRLQREAAGGGDEWQGDRLEMTRRIKTVSYESDYILFHSMPVESADGFNRVRLIDPTLGFDPTFLR